MSSYNAGSRKAPAWLWLVCLCASAALVACSGDGGSETDDGGPDTPAAQAGLQFSYPVNEQENVYPQTQIALSLNGDPGDIGDSLTLVADGTPVDTTVIEDENQPGIFRLQAGGDGESIGRPKLQPDTEYDVRAGGDTLFSFTTRPRVIAPAADGFEVVGYRGDSSDPFPFTQFNTIRLTFSGPVDPGTVQLGETFTVTDSGGMAVPGRLTALGRHLSFDPTEDLAAGETYTVTLASAGDDAVRSVYGDALAANGQASFDLTPVSIGESVQQNLVIEPTSQDVSELPDNGLNGEAANVVTLVSQLIGENVLPAFNNTQRRGLLTRLSEPSDDPRYNGTFPAIIPAGQQFDLGALNLELGGGVPTQINSGNIEAHFINDADVFIVANNLVGLDGPAAVRLRFDLGIGAAIESGNQQQILANGAFNQTVMNVVAAGLAVPQDNGDVKLTTLGSFPTAVNRNGQAITDFELELTLKAGSQDNIQVQPDAERPYITAQYPSACLYTFNADRDYFSDPTGIEPVPLESANEACAQASGPLLNVAMGEPAGITDFLLGQNPSLTFSEPIDSRTLVNVAGEHDTAHLQLMGPGGAVAFTAHTEGNSVVFDPQQPLDNNTVYTMIAGPQLAGLNGQSIEAPGEFEFRTAPYVPALPDSITTDSGGRVNNVTQTAPFITAIQPGLPCALAGGNFLNGGDTAGYCVGDEQDGDAASPAFPVFSLPANRPVQMQFTKPVKTATIQLAESCLTGNGGSAGGASGAVQRMDGASCEGVVSGKIVLPQPDAPLARSFQFVPEEPWQEDRRYWLVICGDEHDQCSADAATIVGRDDGNGFKYLRTDNDELVNAPYSGNLNTNPLMGTGTQPAQGQNLPPNAGFTVATGTFPKAGGPDIVMPFNGAPASRDYAFFANSLPITDVNGNGKFDTIRVPGDMPTEGLEQVQPTEERPVPANTTYLSPEFASGNVAFADASTVYQSGAVPNVVKPLTSNCSAIIDIANTAPAQCVPVTLAPGGMFQLTAFFADRTFGVQIGRTLLRVAPAEGGGKQVGYIVPECTGSLNGESYTYSPCFVQSLTLLVNAPDVQAAPLFNYDFPQQTITLDLVGPVSFLRNGRLVLTLRNTNTAKLDNIINNVFGTADELTITVDEGNANVQLAGPVIHGGEVTKR